MPEGLRIQNVTKTFTAPEGGAVNALDDVSLAVGADEFVVLLGPSGCGKTTLLRTIAGLENADSGEIHLGGERLDTIPPYRRPVNTVFQSYALFPFLTVERNIAFGLEMEKRPKPEIVRRVAEMLDLVELSGLGRRTPSQLSGGQQQRVALARALAKRPKLLLLDEPLGALDLKLRRQMQAELKRIQRTTGIAFVFVTHDQEEALALGDRIAVLNAGRIVQVGSPQEIYEAPATRFVADFIGETNLLPVDYDGHSTLTVAGQWKLDIADVRGADKLALAERRRDAGEPVQEDGAPVQEDGGPVQEDGEPTPPDEDPGTRSTEPVLAVRPERVAMDPAGELFGTVVASGYLGADVHLTVDLGDGLSLNARVDALEQPPDVGTAVGLRIDPRHTRLLTS